jgi:PAS domain S-box-containing protein
VTDYQTRIDELEAKYRLLADSLVDTIWVVDVKTLKFEFVTPSAERISGYRAEEFLDWHISKRIQPESFREAKVILAEELAAYKKGDHRRRTMELEMTHKDGRPYWVELIARIIEESDGSLKIVGVSRDITSMKEHEQRQEETIKQLGLALAEKERLLKENKLLRRLLPICAGCRRIRDENGHWWPMEVYLTKKSGSELTHTICPDCKEVMYQDEEE